MLQVYTGNGKGKTTAALGLGLRTIGAGKKVLLVQFLKDGQSSEIKTISRLKNFEAKAFGRKGFVNKKKLVKKDYDLAKQGFNFVQKAIESKKYDLIILDEINMANYFKLIETKDILKLIQEIPKQIEVILTGRYADKKILQQADLVTQMNEKKHYYQKKIKSRKGIEF